MFSSVHLQSLPSHARAPNKEGVGKRRKERQQGQAHPGELTIGWCLPPHFCGGDIGSHRIRWQLIGISDGKSASLALLVQEGVRGLWTVPPRQWLFTLTGSSTGKTHILVPGRQCVVTRELTTGLLPKNEQQKPSNYGHTWLSVPSHWRKCYFTQLKLPFQIHTDPLHPLQKNENHELVKSEQTWPSVHVCLHRTSIPWKHSSCFSHILFSG